MHERSLAPNDAYRRATLEISAVIANHLLSAIDAFAVVRLSQPAGSSHATFGLDPRPMKILNILLLFVPAAIAAEFMHASPVVIFALSAMAIVPLSGYLGRATGGDRVVHRSHAGRAAQRHARQPGGADHRDTGAPRRV